MKFKNSRCSKKDLNKKRTKNKFLWFPLSINGETRWLEKASWKEQVKERLHSSDPYGYDFDEIYLWEPIKWL